MKMSLKSLIYMLLLPCLSTQAQEQAAAVPFLAFPADARTTGMGVTGTAMPGNYSAVFRNAATAMFSREQMAFGYSYTPWNSDLVSGSALHTIGGYYQLNEKQAILAGFRHFTHAKVAITDENGDFTENFRPSDWSIDLGYSHKLGEHLALALTLRYLRSDMGTFGGADAASAFAFDLGAGYQKQLCADKPESYWSAGLQIANIGSKVKYLETGYDLPASVRLGGSVGYPFSEKHKLTANLDLGYTEMFSDTKAPEWAIGAEYGFLQYGFVRAGYHGGNDEKNSGNYATVGCGAAFKGIHADFAYMIAPSGSPLKNTWQIAIQIKLKAKG